MELFGIVSRLKNLVGGERNSFLFISKKNFIHLFITDFLRLEQRRRQMSAQIPNIDQRRISTCEKNPSEDPKRKGRESVTLSSEWNHRMCSIADQRHSARLRDTRTRSDIDDDDDEKKGKETRIVLMDAERSDLDLWRRDNLAFVRRACVRQDHESTERIVRKFSKPIDEVWLCRDPSLDEEILRHTPNSTTNRSRRAEHDERTNMPLKEKFSARVSRKRHWPFRPETNTPLFRMYSWLNRWTFVGSCLISPTMALNPAGRMESPTNCCRIGDWSPSAPMRRSTITEGCFVGSTKWISTSFVNSVKHLTWASQTISISERRRSILPPREEKLRSTDFVVHKRPSELDEVLHVWIVVHCLRLACTTMFDLFVRRVLERRVGRRSSRTPLSIEDVREVRDLHPARTTRSTTLDVDSVHLINTKAFQPICSSPEILLSRS